MANSREEVESGSSGRDSGRRNQRPKYQLTWRWTNGQELGREAHLTMCWDIVPGLVWTEYSGDCSEKGLGFKILVSLCVDIYIAGWSEIILE